MIKDISKLAEKPISYQKNFLSNCSVYEKISAYFFHIKVVSKNKIKFLKANNKEIDVVELILNRMWKQPIDDFTSMFLSDEDFMEKSVGATYSFFYFPCRQPLLVDYHESMCTPDTYYRYILDNIKMEDGSVISIGYLKDFDKIDKQHLIRRQGICLNNLQVPQNKTFKELLKEKDIEKYTSNIKSWIDDTNLCAASINEAEGFILKYKNEIYQINQISAPQENNPNRLALEIFVHSFVEFLSDTNYMDCISNTNYVSNISSLFIKYYEWLNGNDGMNLFNYYNINADNLTAPTFGWYAGTFWELIPHKMTREICQKDRFYANIFKIMLNGLRKEKRFNANALIMTEEDVRIWNDAVKLLSMFLRVPKKFK